MQRLLLAPLLLAACGILKLVPANGSGEIGLDVQGQYRTYLARSRGVEIAKGMRVKVVENQGGDLIVEPAAN